MAIPDKRQAGTLVLWLGVVFVTRAGVLFLPRDKALRAVQCIQHTLAHSTDTAALRKLCGLLKHVRVCGLNHPLGCMACTTTCAGTQTRRHLYTLRPS
eukprot:812188-Pleurochrysis_carterae.AAC.1